MENEKKRGRPTKENANTTTMRFKLSKELLARLEGFCVGTGRSKGEVVRSSLTEYLKRKESSNDE